jgi:hypothetical protein
MCQFYHRRRRHSSTAQSGPWPFPRHISIPSSPAPFSLGRRPMRRLAIVCLASRFSPYPICYTPCCHRGMHPGPPPLGGRKFKFAGRTCFAGGHFSRLNKEHPLAPVLLCGTRTNLRTLQVYLFTCFLTACLVNETSRQPLHLLPPHYSIDTMKEE